MELKERTCNSCANLCQSADTYIGIDQRKRTADDKHWNVPEISYNYNMLVCYKGRLDNFYRSGKTMEDVRNILIKPNKCRYWKLFINGISPIEIEQKESSKREKIILGVAIVTLIAILFQIFSNS